VSRARASSSEAAAAPSLRLADVAARAGVSRSELDRIFARETLEPTVSIAEVAEHFGCSGWQVSQLVRLGLRYGAALHPTRGGLFPTFKVSHRCRRISLSAIARHKAAMAGVVVTSGRKAA